MKYNQKACPVCGDPIKNSEDLKHGIHIAISLCDLLYKKLAAASYASIDREESTFSYHVAHGAYSIKRVLEDVLEGRFDVVKELEEAKKLC